MRISDADRQRVAEELGMHLSAGRLGPESYAERIEEVMGAETLADLDHARRDLPFLRVAPGGRRGGGAGSWPGSGMWSALAGGESDAVPAPGRSAASIWWARAVLAITVLLLVAGVALAITAQVIYLVLVALGWSLGVLAGRASASRR